MNAPAMLLAAAAVLVPVASEAQLKVCGNRNEVIAALAQNHAEARAALGLMADGGVIELFVAQTGDWTMIVSYPRKLACVVAHGTSWATMIKGDPA